MKYEKNLFDCVKHFIQWRNDQRRLVNAYNSLLSTELKDYSLAECCNAVVLLKPHIPLWAYGELIGQLFNRQGRGKTNIEDAIRAFEKGFHS